MLGKENVYVALPDGVRFRGVDVRIRQILKFFNGVVDSVVVCFRIEWLKLSLLVRLY